MNHGGKIYEYAKQTGLSPFAIIDASANINPLGPPQSVLKAIEQALPSIRYYPDSEHTALLNLLSQRHQIPTSAIVCGNGAAECIDLIVRQQKPKRCVLLEPAFSEYEMAARRHSCEIERIALHQEQNFALPITTLFTLLKKGDLLFLNNPHNPSGTSWPASIWLEPILAFCQQGIDVVIDESFIDFLVQEKEQSLVTHAATNEHLFVIRSATKFYSIPGLRFGYLVGNINTIEKIKMTRDPWSVNQLAQVAALVGYQDEHFTLQTRQWLMEAHQFFHTTWSQEKRIKTWTPHVNYILIQFPTASQASYFQTILQRQGIFTRSCESFRTLDASFVRIALLTQAINEQIHTTFEQTFNDQ